MLNDVVAVLILQQLVSVLVQFLQHGACLVSHAMLQDALDDTAAVGVSGQAEHLPLECVDDELQRVRLHAFYALLHHVVTWGRAITINKEATINILQLVGR